MSIRYLFDGTPDLWHFARKGKIEPLPTTRVRATPTSLSDCEVPHFSFEASPSPSKLAAVLDALFLSPESEVVPSYASSPTVSETEKQSADGFRLPLCTVEGTF